jgi:hypothetical protein
MDVNVVNNILKGYIEAVLWTEEERLNDEFQEYNNIVFGDDNDYNDELEKLIHLTNNLNKKTFSDFTKEDIEVNSLIKAYTDIKKFIEIAGEETIESAIFDDDVDAERIGHDIWLTRNKHGAGFFDGHYSYDNEQKLMLASDKIKEVDVYINDNYKLSFSNENVFENKKLTNTKILVNEEDFNYIKESIKSGEVLKEDLRRWFKEKWVDVSKKVNGKHPPCGRKDADGKSYPKCRPSKKVSKETPKVASSYDKKEKKAMTTQKRRAEKKDPKVGKGNKPTMTRFDEGKSYHKCGTDNTKKMKLRITEEQFKKLTHLVVEEINSDVTFEDLQVLKKINNIIQKQEVIDWFNQNDIDYHTMTDLEMYIIYIEKNMEYESDDFGSVEETDYIPDDLLNEAEYQGRKVKLGKIMQGDVKKFKVYVKNDKGNVVKVNFGFGGKSAKGKRMVIKKNNPERRKSFRARHKCDNPGPRWKPKYWACKTW